MPAPVASGGSESPGGPCTHWKAPPCHGARGEPTFAELPLVRALTDGQIAAMRDPKLLGTVKLPTIEDAVKAGSFLAGRPEGIIEQTEGGR
jgi:hypothetical protein